jgi:hypothetical protein
MALGLSVLVGTASAGLGYLVSEGYRLKMTDHFPLIALQQPVDPSSGSGDTETVTEPSSER